MKFIYFYYKNEKKRKKIVYFLFPFYQSIKRSTIPIKTWNGDKHCKLFLDHVVFFQSCSDMEKDATSPTQGRGNISGGQKNWPNIAKLFPYLHKNKLCIVIICKKERNVSSKGWLNENSWISALFWTLFASN